jgi:hypothetical protein
MSTDIDCKEKASHAYSIQEELAVNTASTHTSHHTTPHQGAVNIASYGDPFLKGMGRKIR